MDLLFCIGLKYFSTSKNDLFISYDIYLFLLKTDSLLSIFLSVFGFCLLRKCYPVECYSSKC